MYNPSSKPAEPKEINSDILFREGQNLMVLYEFSVDYILLIVEIERATFDGFKYKSIRTTVSALHIYCNYIIFVKSFNFVHYVCF